MSNAFTHKPDISAWSKKEKQRAITSKNATRVLRTNPQLRIVLEGSSPNLAPAMMKKPSKTD